MSQNLNPVILRDFSKGVYRKAAVAESIVPQNSVSHAINVNFDTIIGKGVVRSGTTLVGAQVYPSTSQAIGLTEFVPSGSTSGYLIAGYPVTSQGQLFWYNGSTWAAANTTAGVLSKVNKNRFAVLGGRIFRVNGSEAMTSSSDGSNWDTTNCITTNSVIPSLIFKTSSMLLASGYSNFRDRIYFSSVINPNASPTVTWNTDPTTGNWLDVNPDDNSNVTGFAETSGLVLVFKGKGMYRLNAIAKTTDPDNIFNIGAASQEAIVSCQGAVYFFSGQDIRVTTGDLPQQISRLGVQDWIDAIPQANWSSVCAGTDGFNVYFSIGNITLNSNEDDQTTYSNVVLKFSVRDQSWSVHSYATAPQFYAQYTDSSNGRKMICADASGNVQRVNLGTTDNGTPIYFTLETQEQEMNIQRSHTKQISKDIIVLTKNGQDSSFLAKQDDGDFKTLKGSLNNRVNKIDNSSLKGHWFTFKWSGQSKGQPPIFEGIEVPELTDLGIIE